jgi:hypothetical protein
MKDLTLTIFFSKKVLRASGLAPGGGYGHGKSQIPRKVEVEVFIPAGLLTPEEHNYLLTNRPEGMLKIREGGKKIEIPFVLPESNQTYLLKGNFSRFDRAQITAVERTGKI